MRKLIIGKYKGLEIKPAQMFTESDLEIAVIEAGLKLANEWARNNKPAGPGDEVTLNIQAECEGLVVPELLKSNLKYRVGSPEFLEQFKQVAGKKKGERFAMDIVFPENAPTERIGGKTVHFTVTVEDVIHAERRPEITDETARLIDPGVQGIDGLRAKLRRTITANWLQMVREANIQTIIDAIVSGSEYEIDENEFEEVYGEIVAETQKSMFSSTNPAMLEAIFAPEDDALYTEDCRKLAEKTIVEEAVLNEIIRREQIALSDEELEREKLRLSGVMGNESFERLFPTEECWRNHLLQEKTFNLLLEWNLPGTGLISAE